MGSNRNPFENDVLFLGKNIEADDDPLSLRSSIEAINHHLVPGRYLLAEDDDSSLWHRQAPLVK